MTREYQDKSVRTKGSVRYGQNAVFPNHYIGPIDEKETDAQQLPVPTENF